LVATEFKSGGLHEKHVEATWKNVCCRKQHKDLQRCLRQL